MLNEELEKAVIIRDKKKIMRLFLKGVDIDGKNYRGDSALEISLQSKNFEISKILIDLGVDKNTKDCWNRYMLYTLFVNFKIEYCDIVKRLISRGFNTEGFMIYTFYFDWLNIKRKDELLSRAVQAGLMIRFKQSYKLFDNLIKEKKIDVIFSFSKKKRKLL